MTRRPRIAIEIERLLAADGGLAAEAARWRAEGYALSSARLWRCDDGTYSARVVWRRRGRLTQSVVYAVRGLVL